MKNKRNSRMKIAVIMIASLLLNMSMPLSVLAEENVDTNDSTKSANISIDVEVDNFESFENNEIVENEVEIEIKDSIESIENLESVNSTNNINELSDANIVEKNIGIEKENNESNEIQCDDEETELDITDDGLESKSIEEKVDEENLMPSDEEDLLDEDEIPEEPEEDVSLDTELDNDVNEENNSEEEAITNDEETFEDSELIDDSDKNSENTEEESHIEEISCEEEFVSDSETFENDDENNDEEVIEILENTNENKSESISSEEENIVIDTTETFENVDETMEDEQNVESIEEITEILEEAKEDKLEDSLSEEEKNVLDTNETFENVESDNDLAETIENIDLEDTTEKNETELCEDTKYAECSEIATASDVAKEEVDLLDDVKASPSDVEETATKYIEIATTSNTDEASPSNAVEIIEKPIVSIEDLKGTWSVDEVTTYNFDDDGNGAMILPAHKYDFKYTINSSELVLKFDNSKIGEATFIPSIKENVLTLERHQEVGTSVFTLNRK